MLTRATIYQQKSFVEKRKNLTNDFCCNLVFCVVYYSHINLDQNSYRSKMDFKLILYFLKDLCLNKSKIRLKFNFKNGFNP